MMSNDDLKDIECPVCLRIPRSSPVFQCENGHIVCNECHPKLVICSVCRIPLGKIRSRISEMVLVKLPSACKFRHVAHIQLTQCKQTAVIFQKCQQSAVIFQKCQQTAVILSELVTGHGPKLSDQGCTVELMRSDIEAHENECEYR